MLHHHVMDVVARERCEVRAEHRLTHWRIDEDSDSEHCDPSRRRLCGHKRHCAAQQHRNIMKRRRRMMMMMHVWGRDWLCWLWW